MTSLHLIGTVHNDLKGSERLEVVLNHLKPNILAVEGCEDLFKHTEELKEKHIKLFTGVLKSKGCNEELINYLVQFTFGTHHLYERDSSVQFAKVNRVPLVYLDSPEHTDESIRHMEIAHSMALKKLESIERLNEIVAPHSIDLAVEAVDSKYDFLSCLIYSPDDGVEESVLNNSRGHIIGARDLVFEQKLRQLTAENLNSKIAVVIGAAHLLNDPQQQTLYERIKDLQPKRLLLKQYAERISAEKR